MSKLTSSFRFHVSYFRICRLIAKPALPTSAQDALTDAEGFPRQKFRWGPVWAYGHRYGLCVERAFSHLPDSASDHRFEVIAPRNRGAAPHLPI